MGGEGPLRLFSGSGAGPTYIESGRVAVADELREGARIWARAFRDAGLVPGDRIVLAARPGPGFLYVLDAAIARRLTLAPVPASSDLEEMLERFDARWAVSNGGHPAAWAFGPAGEPRENRPLARQAIGPPTPSARLILATSGTTGVARWVVLSDRNLMSVVSSHGPLLDLAGSTVLSSLPWTHAFGLIIDLIPALMAGATIVRDPSGGREPRLMAELIARRGITHLSAVPRVYRRLSEHSGDDSAWRGLRGGVVGGAPVTASLAARLSASRLRVGYGLTEASPGVSLGQPGEWASGYLGRPVGCRVRLGTKGELQFRGPNACLGFWLDGGLQPLDPDRWVETGDLVEIRGEELFYRGRSDDSFKLENGRWIDAGFLEEQLRRRFPAIEEALLFSADGAQLVLAWSGEPAGTIPEIAALREALGAPGSLLDRAVRLTEEMWSRTAKGAIDRRATEARLRGRWASPGEIGPVL